MSGSMERQPSTSSIDLVFQVESSLLINEGRVQCTAVVFARPLNSGGIDLDVCQGALLGGVAIAGVHSGYAAQRGEGLLAFLLEDPMDVRRFQSGDVVRLQRGPAS